MKLEDQVASLELAKKLKELGVKQQSFFKYMSQEGGAFLMSGVPMGDWCSAFNVAELGELLPDSIWNDDQTSIGALECQKASDDGLSTWVVAYASRGEMFLASTEADARAQMLIYLLENSLLNP